MSRNRNSEKGKSLNGGFKLFLILLSVFIFVFVYAHMHIRTLNLGYKYILLQNRKLKLETRNFELKKDLGRMLSLEKIDRISEKELELVYPDSNSISIIRVPMQVETDHENDLQEENQEINTTLHSLLTK